jgi:hypothetical protein
MGEGGEVISRQYSVVGGRGPVMRDAFGSSCER